MDKELNRSELPASLTAFAGQSWALLGRARVSPRALTDWTRAYRALDEKSQFTLINWLQKHTAHKAKEKYPAWLRGFVFVAALMIAAALLFLNPHQENRVFFWIFLPPLMLILISVAWHRLKANRRLANLQLLAQALSKEP